MSERRGSSTPETSIVVRTFNEARHLGPLLDGIARQSYTNHEVIVVDSGSYDGTLEIADQRADRVIRIDSRDFTFGYSLNVGVREARGRYVAIVSAHALPVDERWLERLIDPLRDDSTAMVYGRQLGVASSKFSERLDFHRTFGSRPRTLRPPDFFANNANSAIRKDLWSQRSFDEHLTGLEDIEWSKYWMERGYHVVYQPDAGIYHIHEETWRQVRRRYYREAVAALKIGIKRRADVPREMVAEGRRFAGDLVRLARGRLRGESEPIWTRVPEIVRFRFNKAVGTARGLLNGAEASDPAQREAMYFDASCSAVVIRGPGRAELSAIDMPDVKPGDVLLKVAYEGVCATDLEVLEGTLGYYEAGLAAYPIIPGHELSGTIAKVGANVNRFRGGERVVAECIQPCGRCAACERGIWMGCERRTEMGVMRKDGGYAEFVAVPAHFVHEIPPALSLQKAALAEPLAVVMKGIERLGRAVPAIGARTPAAVVGAGPLGQLCVQALRKRGCPLTVFDRNERRLAVLARQGVRVHSMVDAESLAGAHFIVEATGDPDALEAILRQAPPSAAILLLGLPYARRQFNFESVVAYDHTIIGSVGSSSRNFEQALDLLPELDLEPFLQKTLPLEDYEEAWRLCRAGEYLKVMLNPGGTQ